MLARHAITLCTLAATLAALNGCGSTSTASADPSKNDQSETESLIDQYAQGLSVDQKREPMGASGELKANITPIASAEGEIIVDDPDAGTGGGELGAPNSVAARGNRSAVAATDLDEQIEAYAYEMASMLAQRVARDAEIGIGYADLSRIALLESVAPGVFNTYFINASAETTLTSVQRETLIEFAKMISEAVENMEAGPDEEPLALYTVVRDREESWRGWGELSVPEAHLCTAVYGFGNYTTMNAQEDGRYRLIAGRRYRAVVYAEVDGFSHTPATRDGVEGYETRVSLGMSLYQHQESSREDDDRKGDLLTWKSSEETVEDFSRNTRRDFFLVQQITLPETLSTGRYTLKIRVRDIETDRQTERLVPIDVVAFRAAQGEQAARR